MEKTTPLTSPKTIVKDDKSGPKKITKHTIVETKRGEFVS
jgi:hypothetical protein